MDLQTHNKGQIGRQNALKENATSTNFNPLQWSKWLYELRGQLGLGTCLAEAYYDCHEHLIRSRSKD